MSIPGATPPQHQRSTDNQFMIRPICKVEVAIRVLPGDPLEKHVAYILGNLIIAGVQNDTMLIMHQLRKGCLSAIPDYFIIREMHMIAYLKVLQIDYSNPYYKPPVEEEHVASVIPEDVKKAILESDASMPDSVKDAKGPSVEVVKGSK